jgi:hypothetical protein
MGAPLASVLLPTRAMAQVKRHVLELVDRVGAVDKAATRESAELCPGGGVQTVEHIEFSVRSTLAIGGGYSEAPDPDGARGRFGAEWSQTSQAFAYDEPADRIRLLEQIQEVFGFEPAGQLLMFAVEKTKAAHRVLGELTLYFAEQHGGLVDYGGLLEPWIWRRQKEWLKDVAGQVVVLEHYRENRTKRAKSCVGDAGFARAWLASTEFHMVQ